MRWTFAAKPHDPRTLVQKSADHLKRFVLMIILALSWVSSTAGWVLMESLGRSSPVLRVVFGLNLVFHPVMYLIAWRRLLPLRIVEVSCLLFAAGSPRPFGKYHRDGRYRSIPRTRAGTVFLSRR